MTSWAANDVIHPGLVALVAITLHDHDISFSAHYAFLHTDEKTFLHECVAVKRTKEHIIHIIL